MPKKESVVTVTGIFVSYIERNALGCMSGRNMEDIFLCPDAVSENR